MITYYKNKVYEVAAGNVQKYLVGIACKSSDAKPTENIVSGSLALEVDTGDVYAFDGSDWNKING